MADELKPDSGAPSMIDGASQSDTTTSQPGNLDEALDRGLREVFKVEGDSGDKPDVDDAVDPKPDDTTGDDAPPETPDPITQKKDVTEDDEAPVDPETIKPPAGIGKKQLGEWGIIKKNNKRAWNALNRATEENKKLKTALAERATTTNTEYEQLKKENEELRGLRATVDYEHDPEFIKNYEAPVDTVRSQMASMLERLNVSKQVIDDIDYTDPGVLTRVAKVLETKVDTITANRFLKRGEELVDLEEKRQKALDEHRVNHKQFAENRRKQSEQSSLEGEARINKRLEEVASLKDEKGNVEYPFIAMKEIPATATKTEIAQIQAHNKMATGNIAKVGKLVKMSSPEERAEVAVAAVASAWLNQQLMESQKKVKSLEDTLKKYNDISSDRGGAGAPTTPKGPQSLDLEDSINSAFPQFRSRV